MRPGNGRKNHTHALGIDLAVTSLEAAQDDLLDSLSLVSTKAVPLSEIVNLMPGATDPVREVRSDPLSMLVFCRVVKGLPKEHAQNGTFRLLKFIPSKKEFKAELARDPTTFFLQEKQWYNGLRNEILEIYRYEGLLCRNCYRPLPLPGETVILRCGGCSEPAYCNSTCQAIHWKAGHKVQCKFTRSSSQFNINPSSDNSLLNKRLGAFAHSMEPYLDSAAYSAFNYFSPNPRYETHVILVFVNPTTLSDPTMTFEIDRVLVVPIGGHERLDPTTIANLAPFTETFRAVPSLRATEMRSFKPLPGCLDSQVGMVIFACRSLSLEIIKPASMQPGPMYENLLPWMTKPLLGIEEDWVEGLKRKNRLSGRKLHGGGRGMTEREWDRWCSTGI